MNIDPVWWSIAVVISAFTNIGLMMYFMFTRLDDAEALLYDVDFIRWYKNTFGTSVLGRQARMNALSMAVIMPNLLERRGKMSREAYLRLPASLKKQIYGLYLFLLANGLAMISLHLFT